MKTWFAIVLIIVGYPSCLWAAPYVGADITLQGIEFSAKDEEFTPLGESTWLYACFG